MFQIQFAIRIFMVLFCFSSLASAASDDQSKVKGLAMVILAEPMLPPAKTVQSNLEARLGKRLKIDKMEDGESVILFRISGGTVMIGLVDRPIPNNELQDVCRHSWYWKAACDSVSAHKAHLLVSVLGTSLDKIDASLLLTDVLAALMPDKNAIAVYWGVNLQSRDAFQKQSANISRSQIPIMLWVSFRLSSDPIKGFSISTHGLRDFNLMEIECKDAPTDGRSLFILVANMSDYLLSKGPVIKDGDTIGDSPALNIRVRHAPSFWNEGEKVYRVVYPAP